MFATYLFARFDAKRSPNGSENYKHVLELNYATINGLGQPSF
jgi:hypothetical protein